MASNDLIEVDVEILYINQTGFRVAHGYGETWVPLSVVDIEDGLELDTKCIHVFEWFATKEGMI